MALSFDDLVEEKAASQASGGVLSFDDLLEEPKKEEPGMVKRALHDVIDKNTLATAIPGALEAVAGGVGEMANMAVSGIAGPIKSLFTGKSAADEIGSISQSIRDTIPYLPETEAGKADLNLLSLPMEAIHKGGEAVYEKTGSPLAGAAVETLGNAAMLGFPFMKRGGKRVDPLIERLAKEKELAAKEAEPRMQEGVPQQTELPLNPSQNKFGLDTSKLVVDENGIPIKASPEEISIGNQGELFGRNDPVTEQTKYAPPIETLPFEKQPPPLAEQGTAKPQEGIPYEVPSPNVPDLFSPVESPSRVLGGTGKKGFGQGGAIDFFSKKPPSYESYKKDLERRAGEKVSDGIASKMYKEDHGEHIFQQEKKGMDTKAAIGNIPGLKKATEEKYERFNPVQSFGTPIATLGLRIHPKIGQQILKFDVTTQKRVHESLGSVDTFLSNVGKSSPEAKSLIERALTQNDFALIEDITKNSPAVRAEFDTVRKTLNGLGKELVDAKVIEGLREDYFPRIVKDHKGLLDAMGIEKKNEVLRSIENMREKGVSESDISAFINSQLNFQKKRSKPGFAKARVFDEIPEHLLQFYAPPIEAIHSYIRGAVNKIEAAKFFGKSLTKDAEGRIDISASIGAYINDLLVKGELSKEKVAEGALEDLGKILDAKFRPGSMNPKMRDVMNVSTIMNLGDFSNAAVQFSDIQGSLIKSGPVNTAKAIVYLISGKAGEGSRFTLAKDLGIIDHLSEEFAGERMSDKAVKQVFKKTTLSKLDTVTKNVFLVSQRLAKEGVVDEATSRLYWEFEPRFGERFPQLLEDLRKGEKTRLTDELLASELAKIQPIYPSSKSVMELKHPTYMAPIRNMRSFLKMQIDNAINETYKMYKQGRKEEALKNLVALVVIGGTTTSLVQDLVALMRNKPIPFTTPSDIIPAYLTNLGFSKYVIADLKKEGPVEAAANFIHPATGWIMPPVRDAAYLADEGVDKLYGKDVLLNNKDTSGKKKPFKFESRKLVPFVGDEWYGFSKEGRKAKKDLEKKEKKADLKEKQIERRIVPQWMK